MTTVPVDTRESPTEFIVVLPLGGVEKTSVELTLQGSVLTIKGVRKAPAFKEQLVQREENCFWGAFAVDVALPTSSAYHTITSSLSPDNVLTVVVPKVFEPKTIAVTVQ